MRNSTNANFKEKPDALHDMAINEHDCVGSLE